MNKTTAFSEMLPDLDAGVFEEKINRALADVALGVVTTGKDGKVIIELDMKQIASSNQVNVSHRLKYVRPTANGKLAEENTTATPMHVGVNGRLSLFPETQEKLPLRDRAGT